MLILEYSLHLLAAVCLLLGSLGIFWGRCSNCPHRAFLGRVVFIGTLLLLGAAMQFAAFYRADGIVPLGLLAGVLVVAMVWETPTSNVVTHRI